MKHFLLTMMVLTGVCAIQATTVAAEKSIFGDYKSSTLVGNAWQALEQQNYEDVMLLTNEAITRYEATAVDMQEKLTDFVSGSNDQKHEKWALNDVGTAYFIQGEALRKQDKLEEAAEKYTKVIKLFAYAQTWDPATSSFWKPAEAARDKLEAIKSGANVDFDDMSSSALVQKSWSALAANDVVAVENYVNKILEKYAGAAKDMQENLDSYVTESHEKTASYWALNDVGTALFILGEAYNNAGRKEEAAKVYQRIVDSYFFAQTWDPKGWFWKPAEAAQKKLIELEQ